MLIGIILLNGSLYLAVNNLAQFVSGHWGNC